MGMINTTGRHQYVADAARWLEPNPNLTGLASDVSTRCAELATVLLAHLADGPQLALGLQRLTDAKDCFVRATLEDSDRKLGWEALRQ